MNSSRRAMLLVGSPIKVKSTSDSLGTYLLNALQDNRFEVNKVHVSQLVNFDGTESSACLQCLTDIDNTDVFVLSFPLFIDCLPAITIRALEIIGEHRRGLSHAKRPLMAAIANSGFPEPHQNSAALDMCRCFAAEAGFDWAGGVAVGGGALIQGYPVKKVDFLYRELTKTLRLLASVLAQNQPLHIEPQVYQISCRIPAGALILINTILAKLVAKTTGIGEGLYDQPFGTGS